MSKCFSNVFIMSSQCTRVHCDDLGKNVVYHELCIKTWLIYLGKKFFSTNNYKWEGRKKGGREKEMKKREREKEGGRKGRKRERKGKKGPTVRQQVRPQDTMVVPSDVGVGGVRVH